MTDPIPAKLVPVEQAKVPPCDSFVIMELVGSKANPEWEAAATFDDKQQAKKYIADSEFPHTLKLFRLSDTPQREQDGGWGPHAVEVWIGDPPSRIATFEYSDQAQKWVKDTYGSSTKWEILSLHRPATVEQPLTAGQRALARQTYDDEALVGPAPVEKPEEEVREGLVKALRVRDPRLNMTWDDVAIVAIDYLTSIGWRATK